MIIQILAVNVVIQLGKNILFLVLSWKAPMAGIVPAVTALVIVMVVEMGKTLAPGSLVTIIVRVTIDIIMVIVQKVLVIIQ
jgi:hypothetical protein